MNDEKATNLVAMARMELFTKEELFKEYFALYVDQTEELPPEQDLWLSAAYELSKGHPVFFDEEKLFTDPNDNWQTAVIKEQQRIAKGYPEIATEFDLPDGLSKKHVMSYGILLFKIATITQAIEQLSKLYQFDIPYHQNEPSPSRQQAKTWPRRHIFVVGEQLFKEEQDNFHQCFDSNDEFREEKKRLLTLYKLSKQDDESETSHFGRMKVYRSPNTVMYTFRQPNYLSCI